MSSEFEKVADVPEIPKGKMKMVKLGNVDVLVANVDGNFFAIGNRCTHVGGPLAKGILQNYIVQCPLHGSKFDVRNGTVLGGPARTPEPSFEVKIENNQILLKKPVGS